jgi:hypothetical protein
MNTHEMLLSPTQLEAIETQMNRLPKEENLVVAQLLLHQRALGKMYADANKMINAYIQEVADRDRHIEGLVELISEQGDVEHNGGQEEPKEAEVVDPQAHYDVDADLDPNSDEPPSAG